MFSDLDGTLLQGYRIRLKDRIAIKKEIKNDLMFVISTGRNFKSFTQFLFFERIKFSYAVLGNGSQIINFKKEIIHEVSFETDKLLEVLYFIINKLGNKIKLSVTVSYRYKTEKFGNYKIGDAQKIIKEFPDKVSVCSVDLKGGEFLEEDIRKITIGIKSLNVGVNGKYLDITKNNVNKKHDVLKVLEYVDEEEKITYAIGDSHNDISMLKAVDFSFAISTGVGRLKILPTWK